MIGINRISGFVIFFLGAILLWEGRNLSIGNFSSPGPGFFPMLLATLLMIFSLVLIIPNVKKKNDGQPLLSWSTIQNRLLPVFGALLGYFFFLEYLGFVVAGFLLMIFLFVRIGSLRWYVAVSGAFISIVAAYLLFGVLIKSNLPQGILGF
jgi:hypothetical protein